MGEIGLRDLIQLVTCIVAVTGVVVGMRSAIAVLAEQLREQRMAMKELTAAVNGMAQRIAVLEYAQGIESILPDAKRSHS